MASLLAPVVSADACEPTPDDEIVIDALGRQFYVDVDIGAPDAATTGLVLYEEANAIAGLQRDDARADGTCGGLIEPDSLIVFV